VILLGGVVFNAFAGAVIMFVQSVVVARKAQAILFWLMGSLSVETLQLRELLVAAAVVAGATAFLFRDARALNALSMGDDGARRLGVDVDRLRRRLLVACCLVVGAAVSVGGMIGFVGLVVPHALRLLVGPDHRLLLPAAALGGAGFLVLCDLGARALFPVLTTELPVGVITAAVGCPLFLYLLWREREALA
jgi:iron complex transport system permease protein